MRKKIALISTLSCWIVLVLTFTVLSASAGSAVTQSFALQPGWNAIFLEVDPDPNDMAAAFNGLPIASVWTWNPRGVAVQYIQSPGEALRNDPNWRVYFPPSRGVEAFLANLFKLQANRAYLVEVSGNAAVTWTVSGQPSLKRRDWVPNSFNLTGFSVDPNSPPQFGSFFAGSKAHAGQAIYRLSGAGRWEFVQNPFGVNMRSGEAFWIYTEGSSDYAGPLQIRPESGYDLAFHTTIPERVLNIRNISSVTKTVTLRLVNPDAGFPLEKFGLDENGRDKWSAFGPVESLVLAPGQKDLFRLAVRRAGMNTTAANAILEISDGAGVLYRIPMGVRKDGI